MAINTLVGVMREKKSSPSARVAAAVALLDRGWGKPSQAMEITQDRPLERLTDEELTAMVREVQQLKDGSDGCGHDGSREVCPVSGVKRT